MKNPYPDASIRTEYLKQFEFGSPERSVALGAMTFVLNKVDAFMKEKYETPKTAKIYSAVFVLRNTDNSDNERVEFFCDKDLVTDDTSFEPKSYATDFLMAGGHEYLDGLIEEDAITDPREIQGILEEALNYIRSVREEHGFEQDDVEQRLEKLLVSHVATTT